MFLLLMVSKVVSANKQARCNKAGSRGGATGPGEFWGEEHKTELPERCHLFTE